MNEQSMRLLMRNNAAYLLESQRHLIDFLVNRCFMLEIQRGNAPVMTENESVPEYVETSEHKFDLVDSKECPPIREFETGTAHYINEEDNNTFYS